MRKLFVPFRRSCTRPDIRPTILLTAVLTALLLLLAGCGSGRENVPTFVPPTASTTSGAASFISRPTYVVTRDTLTEQIVARGDLVAAQQETLLFPMGGVVKEVYVEPGDEVTEGTVLAELNALSVEETLLSRTSSLAIAKLELARVEARVPNTATLVLTSTLGIDLAEARERVNVAEALQANAQAQYDAAVLKAPFDGTVISFNKQQGGSVGAYEAVGLLANLGEVEVQAMLPDTSRARVSAGMAAEVTFDGYAGTTFGGVVTALADDAVASQGALVFPMTIALDPGQTPPPAVQIGADVTIVGEVHADVPWVPANALVMVGDQAYVDVLRDNRIERVPVTLGITDGQRVEVATGLQAGDTIVFP